MTSKTSTTIHDSNTKGTDHMGGKNTKKTPTEKSEAPKLQLRQGDVLLTQVDAIPADAVEQKRGKSALVLQHGTATGHSHAIPKRAASLHDGKDGARFLRVVEPVELKHEEHDTVAIPAGDYVVVIHSEYAPGELPRQVVD